ncbi:hypothetical protein [Streptococcus sanguinis]|jgi:conserved hypothetical membrane associated protein|uniref:Membrane associated protein n=1 Tax=Streptococcus sanguinis TaxID=1305 RepID=A0AB74DLM3_STRSA|nr:hypothetical protein [Streptococcus sanguinis]MBZ2062443.1 hypothetical protein [Streptococcus sanguinis]MBZ2064654.1 hypothetical protein [Streptococcus sanguinis]RSI32585.1 hypothetical protein D8879_03700 [Streptococcus sanguinis]RSI37839.1 hypothetical protein D8878_02490 [Streptococcus sanguinis]
MSRKKDDSNQQPEWFSWIWILVFVFGSGAVASYLIPIAILGAIGYGIYRHQSQKKVRIEAKQASIGRIEDLKSEIGQADRRIKKLEGYQEDGDQESYQNLALEILPQLTYIKNAANDLRGEIPASVYQRIQTKIRTVTDEIDEQLRKIEREKKRKEAQPKKTSLEELAPELVATVRNIQIDHEAILQKISQSESNNKEELTAIHQSQMEHYEDILEGYLKIKASPKDFYNAEERLAKAKAAIEQFDLDLDEALRQLNEADLRDFDISLRILDKEKHTDTGF